MAVTGDSASTPVWDVDVDEIPHLIARILDPARQDSLVLVSPGGDTGRPRIDVDTLAARLAELPADIAVLATMTAANALSDSISDAFRSYGGSVRVVMPDAKVTDHRRHPLILVYPEDDPAVALARIVAAVERTPYTSTPAPSPTAPTLVIPRPGPHLIRHPPEPATASPLASEPDPAPGGDDGIEPRRGEGPTWGTGQPTLADIEEVVSRAVARTLEEQLGGPNSNTERERSRAVTAEEALDEARTRIAHLTEEVARARHDLVAHTVFSDPEQQLRWELATLWLLTTPEHARNEQPLADYTVTDAFLQGLTKHVVPRDKTITVMIDVLRGQGWDDRVTHQFKESKAGNARLSPTGTPMWRTYIKADSPQAPRLTWWQNPDLSYCFDHVGGHDDLL